MSIAPLRHPADRSAAPPPVLGRPAATIAEREWDATLVPGPALWWDGVRLRYRPPGAGQPGLPQGGVLLGAPRLGLPPAPPPTTAAGLFGLGAGLLTRAAPAAAPVARSPVPYGDLPIDPPAGEEDVANLGRLLQLLLRRGALRPRRVEPPTEPPRPPSPPIVPPPPAREPAPEPRREPEPPPPEPARPVELPAPRFLPDGTQQFHVAPGEAVSAGIAREALAPVADPDRPVERLDISRIKWNDVRDAKYVPDYVRRVVKGGERPENQPRFLFDVMEVPRSVLAHAAKQVPDLGRARSRRLYMPNQVVDKL